LSPFPIWPLHDFSCNDQIFNMVVGSGQQPCSPGLADPAQMVGPGPSQSNVKKKKKKTKDVGSLVGPT
jgi:hypothetical protein